MYADLTPTSVVERMIPINTRLNEKQSKVVQKKGLGVFLAAY